MFDKDVRKRTYGWRLLLVIDQLLNVLVLNGSQDETMSSNIGRKIAKKQIQKVNLYFVKFLEFHKVNTARKV